MKKIDVISPIVLGLIISAFIISLLRVTDTNIAMGGITPTLLWLLIIVLIPSLLVLWVYITFHLGKKRHIFFQLVDINLWGGERSSVFCF